MVEVSWAGPEEALGQARYGVYAYQGKYYMFLEGREVVEVAHNTALAVWRMAAQRHHTMFEEKDPVNTPVEKYLRSLNRRLPSDWSDLDSVDLEAVYGAVG